MEVSFVVLDWSGTVSDDRRPVYEANMELLKLHGKPTMTFEEWLPRTRLTAAEFLADNGVTEDPQVLSVSYKKYFNEALARGVRPVVYPDVMETFRYLKGRRKKLAVLSSHPTQNLRREAEDYGLAEFFVEISGDARDKTQGIVEISERQRESLDGVLYVGDTIYDIQAAKKAGVFSAGVCTGYHTKERLAAESPTILLDRLSDMMRHL